MWPSKCSQVPTWNRRGLATLANMGKKEARRLKVGVSRGADANYSESPDRDKSKAASSGGLQGDLPWTRSVHGAATTVRTSRRPATPESPLPAPWPPVPDMFDVITYFLARGESYTVIASIGFWTKDNPGKALTARGLQRWYEIELARRTAALTQ